MPADCCPCLPSWATQYGLFTRREWFGRASCGSSSFWWENQVFAAEILPAAIRAQPVRAAGLRCYCDCGSAEGISAALPGEVVMVRPMQNVAAVLQQAGMVLGADLQVHVDAGGAHESNNFWRRLRRSMAFLWAPELSSVVADDCSDAHRGDACGRGGAAKL